MAQIIRFNGQWFQIHAKPYEPERQTIEIAWLMVKNSITPQEAYRKWFATERNNAKVLYPSFRKEKENVGT